MGWDVIGVSVTRLAVATGGADADDAERRIGVPSDEEEFVGFRSALG